MKALKILAIIVAVLVGLAALLLIVALIPAVQTWAVRKAVADQPGMKIEVARVAAGLGSADIRNLRVVKDGNVITATAVKAKYSAWDYLSSRRVTVHDLTVDGLEIDARAADASATKAASAGEEARAGQRKASGNEARDLKQGKFNGLLTEAKLPVDLQIAKFSIPGRALLPGDRIATFELRGSDITTGKRGTIDWRVDIAMARPESAIRSLHSSGSATLGITTERRIDSADVNAIVSVEGPNLPSDQMRLEAKIEQPAAGANEGYNAVVSLVRGASVEQLATIAGRFDTATRQITGAWKINVRTEQLAAMLSGLGLPDASVTGAGNFTLEPDKGATNATGALQSIVSRLEKISPDLAPIGSLTIESRFDGGLAENQAHLAQFSLEATAANGRKLAQINALQRIAFSLADKRVSFANAKADLARISVQGLPLAWAQPFAKPLVIDSGEVSMILTVAAETDGSRVRVNATEPLAARNVTIRRDGKPLVEQLAFSVRPQAEYSADRLQAELTDLMLSTPAGDRIAGKLTANITALSTPARQIAFTSDLRTHVVTLLKPYFPVDTGPLTITTKSTGTFATPKVQMKSLHTEVTRPSGPPVATIELAQPLEMNLETKAFTTGKPEADTLRVRIGELPLAWAEPFVAQSKLAGAMTGGELAIVARTLEEVSAKTTSPITIRGATVAMDGKPMLQNVDVAADFSAAKAGNVVRYDVRRLEAKQGPIVLASLAATGDANIGEKVALKAKGSLKADTAALMRQPIAAGSATLSRGDLEAEFETTIGDTLQADATIQLRNLIARQNNQSLGDAQLVVTATLQADGSSVLKAPFTLTNGERKTDVLIDGKLARSAAGVTFEGRITSDQLFLDDVKPLAALAPGKSETAPATAGTTRTPPPAPRPVASPADSRPGATSTGTPGQSPAASGAPTPDEKPFWAGTAGKMEVDCKVIHYGRDYTITGLKGLATISPTQLSLAGLEGRLKNNPFRLAGSIDFDRNQPQPYSLQGAANVTEFDIGELLRAGNPNEPPQLETKVNVDAKLNGKGISLGNLLQNVYGNFDATGSRGVLRALGKKGGQAVNVGSALLGVLGAARGSDTTVAVADLTRKLEVLPFERFTMQVQRGADLNLNIGKIEFLAPDTRIVGTGGIVHQPGVPIQNQPLKITLTLAGKDGMAHLLNRAGLLSNEQDDQGFYRMGTSFTIGGTPAKPDSKDFWRIIAEAGIKAAGSRFLGQ